MVGGPVSDNQHEPHDANFERALTRGLKGQPGPDSACPDAETLAAFSDQSLAPDERRFWEAHCAACMRCQARLAALAQTSAVEDDLAQEGPSTRFGWLTDWRWLAPMATAAVIMLAVWGIDPAPLSDPPMPTVGDADVAADAESVRQSAERSQPAAQERQDVSRAEREAERENVAVETDGSPPTDAASLLDQVVPSEPPDLEAPRDEPRNRASPASTPVELAERRLLPESPDARGATGPLSTERFEASRTIPIASGDGSIRWRIVPPGRVEHSVDGGATWTVQLADTGAPMSAGVSPSSSVCWIVGQSGTILRTVDGGDTWEQVEAPRPVDLTGVDAVDGQAARVDAVDGVSFRTEDGGLTWER